MLLQTIFVLTSKQTTVTKHIINSCNHNFKYYDIQVVLI